MALRGEGSILLALDRETTRPLTAAELAQVAGIEGNREWQRRAVRKVVTLLRSRGNRIAAVNHDQQRGGYFIARSPGEWRKYLAARRSGALFTFAAIKRMRERAMERASGQRTIEGIEPGI